MITMLGSSRKCCDGIDRRETLQAGSLAMLGSMFGIPGNINYLWPLAENWILTEITKENPFVIVQFCDI